MGRYRRQLAPGVASFAETPLASVLGTLTSRWAILTLEALPAGHSHFNGLQRCLDGISHKVLADTLRVLQRDGFVVGPLTSVGAAGYHLTPLGRELVDLVGSMRGWAEEHRLELRQISSEPEAM
jgi:DNA-binding HxlR family transcriptional regulator